MRSVFLYIQLIVQTENIDLAMRPQADGTVAQSDEHSQNHVRCGRSNGRQSEAGTDVENGHCSLDAR